MQSEQAQTTVQKLITVCTGCGGISLYFAPIVTIIQQIGVVVGTVLVCGQAYIFFRGLFRKKYKVPSNDA